MEATKDKVEATEEETPDESEEVTDEVKFGTVKDRDGVPVVGVGPHDAREKAKGGA